jgi:hypothetical protein
VTVPFPKAMISACLVAMVVNDFCSEVTRWRCECTCQFNKVALRTNATISWVKIASYEALRGW